VVEQEDDCPSAEYGRSNGGVIMVNQKYGANDLHGTLFEFFRNKALNARNLFATTGPKPRFRRNQRWFVLGAADTKKQDVLLCRLAGNTARHRRGANKYGSDKRAETRSVHANKL
jgi:hypothetical protein